MNTADLSLRLRELSTSRLKLLAALSGVGERTLWKIRAGTTKSASEETKAALALGFKRLPRKRP